LSPDGKLFVYATEDAGQRVDLFFGRTSGGGHVRLTNDSAYESAPRYSPDGERIAFTRRGSPDGTPEICTMPALGGPIACIIRPGAGATWSPDGSRLGFLRPAGAESPVELVTARADGTDVRVLLRGDSQYPFPRQPAWSPDGTHLAVVRGTGGIAGELWLVPASGGAPRKLSDESPAVFSQAPVFTPDGRGLVYSSNRGGAINIWFRALDGSAPRQLTTGAGPDEWPSVARDGVVTFVNARSRNTLDVYGVSGGAPKILLQHSPYLWAPAFSPDGRDLAYTRGEVDGSWHIWTMPAGGGEARRLTSSATGEIYPRYTPDGQFVLYHTWGSPSRIWRVPAAGGTAQPVSSGTHSDGYADVSPDGRWIAFVRAEREGERIYVAPFDGGPERRLTASPGSVPRWSPDGRQIAFSRNRSFNDGIVVIDADGTHERRLTEKGGWPVWWPGGGRVAYLTLRPDQRQEIHVVSTDGAMPAPLAHVRFVHNNHPFDISRDRQWLATSNTMFVADEIWLLKPLAPMRAAQ
jgi:Tol biopolymer transport system component